MQEAISDSKRSESAFHRFLKIAGSGGFDLGNAKKPRDSCFSSNANCLAVLACIFLFSFFVLWMHLFQILAPSNRCDRRPTVSLCQGQLCNETDTPRSTLSDCQIMSRVLSRVHCSYLQGLRQSIDHAIGDGIPKLDGAILKAADVIIPINLN